MTRSIARLTDTRHDLLVIGGGIQGAFVAWDAALRGLKVALVEQGDFAGSTSGNSQRILHGGFRYLQQLDWRRARESALERSCWFRIAPHHVRPLPVLVLTKPRGEPPPPLVSAGMMIYKLIIRSGAGHSEAVLPPPRRVSAAECAALAPWLGAASRKPGILFHDGYARDADRLVLSVIRSAARVGAAIANYVRVTGPLRGDSGVRAVDALSGRSLDIRARAVANCGGPWADEVRGLLGGARRPDRLVRAFLLATRREISGPAVGLPTWGSGARGGPARYLFVTPTRSGSLVGTWYAPHTGGAGVLNVSEDEVAMAIRDVHRSGLAATVRRNDVLRVHAGLLPSSGRFEDGSGVSCARTPRVHVENLAGVGLVISLVGVKFTTARVLAERAVDEIANRLQARLSTSRTRDTLLAESGALTPDERRSVERLARERRIGDGVIGTMIDRYGSASHAMLRQTWAPPLAGPVSPGSSVIGAQIAYAARSEMAQKLTDVVFRRTGLAEGGAVDEAALRACASLLGAELGWSESRMREEIAEVKSAESPYVPA